MRFYGEHSSMWVREEELVPLDMEDYTKLHDLKAWGRHHHKCSHHPIFPLGTALMGRPEDTVVNNQL